MLRRDPVCGNAIGLSQLYFRIAYRGEMYLVCSVQCQHAFLLEPEKYAAMLAVEGEVREAPG